MSIKTTAAQLRKLLLDGEIKHLAARAGATSATVSIALKRARLGNRFVIEALKIARESGVLGVAQVMASPHS